MINITIDGHVGSGKSTLAKGIAKVLNFKTFDTGAVYRSLACAFREKYAEVNEENINEFIKDIKVQIKFENDLQHVIVDGEDFTPYIRTEEISMLSSVISPYQVLRDKVTTLQRDFAKAYNCVMEGRDIGTIVLPNADVKFFITADEKVRAKRRFEQIKDKKDSPSFEEILKDLRERDYKDEHRAVAPLKPADDAVIIDTSDMSLEETIDRCVNIIKERVGLN